MNPTTEPATQETLANVPGVSLPELTVTMATKAPSFAALMGTFRAEHESEVQAAAALFIGATTLNSYCEATSLPSPTGIKRLAPLVGIPADEMAALVELQRAAQARGESIATVPPVRTCTRRLPVPPAGLGCEACYGEGICRPHGTSRLITCPKCGPAVATAGSLERRDDAALQLAPARKSE